MDGDSNLLPGSYRVACHRALSTNPGLPIICNETEPTKAVSARKTPMVMRAISTTAGAMQVWPEPGRWTYDDYARLPDDGYRYELVEGELFMSPSLVPFHQRVLLRLAMALEQHVRETGAGEVLVAPCDVVLGPGTVVEPDILFVSAAREAIVGPKHVTEAPDLVVEILSPSDPDHDRVRKFALYAQHGVREYWIVDLAERTVDVFVLAAGAFALASRAGPNEWARSRLL